MLFSIPHLRHSRMNTPLFAEFLNKANRHYRKGRSVYLYWNRAEENGESKAWQLRGFVERAAILVDLYQKRLIMETDLKRGEKLSKH